MPLKILLLIELSQASGVRLDRPCVFTCSSQQERPWSPINRVRTYLYKRDCLRYFKELQLFKAFIFSDLIRSLLRHSSLKTSSSSENFPPPFFLYGIKRSDQPSIDSHNRGYSKTSPKERSCL
jgi:hypothetical protein